MKKNNIILFLLIALAIGCNQEKEKQGFTVRAKIDNRNYYSLFYLAELANGEFIRDTSYTIDGDWIIFEGEVEEPVLATLGVQGNPALIIPIENGEQGGIIPGP